MKKITSTITSRNFTARVYINKDDILDTMNGTVCGETIDGKIDNGVERNHFGNGIQVLKLLNISEPLTATYEMTLDKFLEIAHESEGYKYGFINRKIGGEVANVVVINTDTLQTYELQVETGTEKQIQKSLNDNEKLVKILNTEKINEKYYYLSPLEFLRNATIKVEKIEIE